MGGDQVFKIGERNYTVLKKLLWKNNILMAAEDVGGSSSRTVHFDLGLGQVVLSASTGERGCYDTARGRHYERWPPEAGGSDQRAGELPFPHARAGAQSCWPS
jgi:hypothetical protein